jgi:hypothetical protein
MSVDTDNFLRRWARRKREAAKTLPAAAPEAPVSELPPIEKLDFESDFSAFLRAKVDEGVRRAALKRLFSDPRFNVMDGLDIYIDDYSREDPIPNGLLAQLEHARSTLFGPQREERQHAQEGTPSPQTSSNAPPEKDRETSHASKSEV